MITNGYRVWQRSIPIGGNHFTKALTKELKLTFAKAEHLKRNAMKAENPKLVFQAMRPVFSDLVAEIQRSIGFFTSNNRTAKLGERGRARQPDEAARLAAVLVAESRSGGEARSNNSTAWSAAASRPGRSSKRTSSRSASRMACACKRSTSRSFARICCRPEIITKRLVRAKKPWAVAAAALLLSGMAVNYFAYYSAWRSAATDRTFSPAMASALDASKKQVEEIDQGCSANKRRLVDKFDDITKIGQNLQSNVDGRLLWLELLKAVDSAMPKDTRPAAATEGNGRGRDGAKRDSRSVDGL